MQALARAGEAQGLAAEAAARLARGALRSAGAGLETGEVLDALIGLTMWTLSVLLLRLALQGA